MIGRSKQHLNVVDKPLGKGKHEVGLFSPLSRSPFFVSPFFVWAFSLAFLVHARFCIRQSLKVGVFCVALCFHAQKQITFLLVST
jgi:hypothetical protein